MSGTSLPPEALGDRATLPPRAMPQSPSDPAPRPKATTAAIAAGFALAKNRLANRATGVAALLALLLAIVGAVIERSVGTAGAVDRALAGTFGLVVPLLTFWIARVASAREKLRDAAWPAARFGLPRREVAIGIVVGAALIAAALSVLVVVATVVVASSPSSPPVVRDALESAFIAAVAAATYVGWFSFGGTFLARGGGCGVVLAADFLVGGSTGILGTILPRGNITNLLGGAAPLGLNQPSSTAILIASAFVLAIGAGLRCGE